MLSDQVFNLLQFIVGDALFSEGGEDSLGAGPSGNAVNDESHVCGW